MVKDTMKHYETLKSISEFQRHYPYSPSLKDLADELGLSEAGVSLRIQRLEEKGCLERVGNRALRITEKGLEALELQNGLFPTEGTD